MREQFRSALRIGASHAALFTVLLVLARDFADSGNTRAAICAYLCLGVAALAAPTWIIARFVWQRLPRDAKRSRWGWLADMRPRGFALVHAGSLLASLLMLAVSAGLLVQAPTAVATTSLVTRMLVPQSVVVLVPHHSMHYQRATAGRLRPGTPGRRSQLRSMPHATSGHAGRSARR